MLRRCQAGVSSTSPASRCLATGSSMQASTCVSPSSGPVSCRTGALPRPGRLSRGVTTSGRRVRLGASIYSSLGPRFDCPMDLRVADRQAELRYRVQAPDEVDLPYVKVCCKTGRGQVRAHCRQLVFRALRGSAVERDDRVHLDGRGDLNSGAAREPYPIALSAISCRTSWALPPA